MPRASISSDTVALSPMLIKLLVLAVGIALLAWQLHGQLMARVVE